VKKDAKFLALPILVLALASCSGASTGSDAGDAAATTSTAEPTVEVAPAALPINASGLLSGSATPSFPAGNAGEVSVVQVGPLSPPLVGATLPIAFRNNTSKGISHVDWSATARVGGAIASTGSSQGTIPAQVAPGEVGLAFIYFENGEAIGEGADYDFDVETSPMDTGSYNTAPLAVTEANLVGDAISGSATNATGAQTVGPYSVHVYCFDGDELASQVGSYAEQDGEVEDGGTVSFTVSLYEKECSSYIVGVGGYFS
jgi:hypothetical protein